MLLPSIDYEYIEPINAIPAGLRTDYSISVTYKIQVAIFGEL
jgi:hypothetical protein